MRSYDQWCALAKALDVVGERWSLLVVRELLGGPKRYTDLREGIPGIATDVLAARLKDLEDDGVIARRTLPPPAASKVYELTPMGRGLEPAVLALARWGSQLLGPKSTHDAFRPHWLALGLRPFLRNEEAADVVLDVDFDLDTGTVRVRIEDGDLATIAEPNGEADVVIHADLGTLSGIANGTIDTRSAIADGSFSMEGSRDAVRTYRRLFRPVDVSREAGAVSTASVTRPKRPARPRATS